MYTLVYASLISVAIYALILTFPSYAMRQFIGTFIGTTLSKEIKRGHFRKLSGMDRMHASK